MEKNNIRPKVNVLPEWRIIPFINLHPERIHLLWSMTPEVAPFALLMTNGSLAISAQSVDVRSDVISYMFSDRQPIVVSGPNAMVMNLLKLAWEKDKTPVSFCALRWNYIPAHAAMMASRSLSGAWDSNKYDEVTMSLLLTVVYTYVVSIRPEFENWKERGNALYKRIHSEGIHDKIMAIFRKDLKGMVTGFDFSAGLVSSAPNAKMTTGQV